MDEESHFLLVVGNFGVFSAMIRFLYVGDAWACAKI
jgi:hypothetical protein